MEKNLLVKINRAHVLKDMMAVALSLDIASHVCAHMHSCSVYTHEQYAHTLVSIQVHMYEHTQAHTHLHIHTYMHSVDIYTQFYSHTHSYTHPNTYT